MQRRCAQSLVAAHLTVRLAVQSFRVQPCVEVHKVVCPECGASPDWRLLRSIGADGQMPPFDRSAPTHGAKFRLQVASLHNLQ